ncbi:promotilin [Vombatus ursinus]|uniref:promotilin n=1 Tax=Vombatus ursinus TaxID=29139 RepID=UPI000FFDAEF3|nr:promotilin [Vombatus ursinus]
MVSSKLVATMLVMYTATMLAAQTEGFVPIFTYSDVQRMQERERNKGQKKSLSVQQRSEEEDPIALLEFNKEEENEMIKLTAPVEIGIRMNSRQLEKYRGVLEELLTEVLLSTQNGRCKQMIVADGCSSRILRPFSTRAPASVSLSPFLCPSSAGVGEMETGKGV